MALHRRLLQDIAEIQQNPYPNVKYIPYDDNIWKGCLILTPDGYAPLHLRVQFNDHYPLRAPRVTIQSGITHPNIFGDFICATILNTTEGWTSAYTLKGICIQLLSFFGSDSLEQDYGGTTVDLTKYKAGNDIVYPWGEHRCERCGYNSFSWSLADFVRPLPPGADPKPRRRRRGARRPRTSEAETSCSKDDEETALPPTPITSVASFQTSVAPRAQIADLPNEILAQICSYLETEELVPFSRAWNRIGTEEGVVTKFNIIQNRELICFTLKRGFQELKLGVGVHIQFSGRIGSLQSEFDLISEEAYLTHNVRRAIQGREFEHWLPLAISPRHYDKVKLDVLASLQTLAKGARCTTNAPESVIYAFMSDIIVRLSQTADQIRSPRRSAQPASTLSHASEKAIESYYHLFHLLLCMAIDDPRIIREANKTIKSFLDGKTSKQHVPNLGQLLIAVLISDADMTRDLLMAIIREAITRNVVWMLDRRGANMPELAYMEANEVSTYRLEKTFEASLTSYRLLMFQNTFRKTINRGTPTGRKSLVQLRDELFNAHGAPPLGTAAKLANDIRLLQQVNSFPQFLSIMGLAPPPASHFTSFLRRTLEDSVKAGYSIWGISQRRALTLRQQVDLDVIERKNPKAEWRYRGTGKFVLNFFPSDGMAKGGNDRRTQAGRR